MGKVIALGFGVLCFCVGLYVYFDHQDGPARRGERDAPPDTRWRSAVDDLSRRIDLLSLGGGDDPALLARIAEMEARIEELGARLEAAEKAAGDRPAAEAEDLSKLSTKDLGIRARSAYGRRDFAVAAKLYEAFLAREPAPERDEKGQAELSLGFCHRMLEDREKELAAFQSALDTWGEDTAEGLTALFQVGWTNASLGNDTVGRDHMLRVAEDPRSNPYIRKWARYWSADYSVRIGDTGRARTILDGIVEEYADATEQSDRQLLQYAKAKLAELDG